MQHPGEQTHAELLALQYNRVRISHLFAHLLAEFAKVRDAHDARVAKPASVRRNSARRTSDLCAAHGALL
eukprot:8038636-Ditylum_brightwellii.AAC.1